jgi:DNA polymerase-3 subunit gamma/tau
MVCKDPETVKLMEVGAGIREKYLAQSRQVSLAFIYEGLEICNQADIQFRASRNQRLSIELALVKLANLSGVSKKKTVTDLPAEDSAQAEIPEAETRQPDDPQTETVQPDVPQTEVNPADLPGDSAPAKEVGNGASRTIRNAGISIKESLRKPIEPAQAAETEGELKESEDTGPAVSSEKENMDGTAAITFSPEAIQGAWKEYASSLEKSKPRIFSTLSSNQPVVGEDGLVRVYLNSEAQRDNFNKNIKSDLLRYIKSHAGISRVEIIAEVSESEDNGKKIYTEQDKLDFLIKKNPELGMLKSRFNLDFDD